MKVYSSIARKCSIRFLKIRAPTFNYRHLSTSSGLPIAPAVINAEEVIQECSTLRASLQELNDVSYSL